MNSLSDAERALLRAAKQQGAVEFRRGQGAAECMTPFMPEGKSASYYDAMEAISGLVARRLAYINFSQPDPTYWAVFLTGRGYRVLESESASPDDPTEYMARLLKAHPDTSPEIQFYLTEALRAYEGEAYAASTVMVGVAAEQCFYEVAEPFAKWLKGEAHEKFTRILENPKTFYVFKMEEFQKRLMVSKSLLTPELADSLETQIIAAMHLIRANRNDAGHPTKILVDSGTSYTNLAIYFRLHQKLYALRKFFIEASV